MTTTELAPSEPTGVCAALEAQVAPDRRFILRCAWPILDESLTYRQAVDLGRRNLIAMCEQQQLVVTSEPQFAVSPGLIDGEPDCLVLTVLARVISFADRPALDAA